MLNTLRKILAVVFGINLHKLSDRDLSKLANNLGVKVHSPGYEYPTEDSVVTNRESVVRQISEYKNQKTTGYIFLMTLATLILSILSVVDLDFSSLYILVAQLFEKTINYIH